MIGASYRRAYMEGVNGQWTKAVGMLTQFHHVSSLISRGTLLGTERAAIVSFSPLILKQPLEGSCINPARTKGVSSS